MGWPRKDEVMRLYQDKDGSYIVIDVERPPGYWQYSALANVYAGKSPSLVSTNIAPTYITQNWLKRVQWSDLPDEWKIEIQRWLDYDGLRPEDVRGFWRLGQQPASPVEQL